jgi:hypothetical protein
MTQKTDESRRDAAAAGQSPVQAGGRHANVVPFRPRAHPPAAKPVRKRDVGALDDDDFGPGPGAA